MNILVTNSRVEINIKGMSVAGYLLIRGCNLKGLRYEIPERISIFAMLN